MPARKMKVDVVDGNGNRYTVTFAGNVTRDKAIRLLEIVELLGGMPDNANAEGTSRILELSKFDKVRLIVEKHFPIVWFASKDVKAVYEQEFREPIGLSTVSTYLSRMVSHAFLHESGVPNHKRYRVTTEATQLNYTKKNK